MTVEMRRSLPASAPATQPATSSWPARVRWPRIRHVTSELTPARTASTSWLYRAMVKSRMTALRGALPHRSGTSMTAKGPGRAGGGFMTRMVAHPAPAPKDRGPLPEDVPAPQGPRRHGDQRRGQAPQQSQPGPVGPGGEGGAAEGPVVGGKLREPRD